MLRILTKKISPLPTRKRDFSSLAKTFKQLQSCFPYNRVENSITFFAQLSMIIHRASCDHEYGESWDPKPYQKELKNKYGIQMEPGGYYKHATEYQDQVKEFLSKKRRNRMGIIFALFLVLITWRYHNNIKDSVVVQYDRKIMLTN